MNAAQRLAQMLRIRRFEEQCILLSRAGRFRGHYHVYIGQEPTAVAACEALGSEDFIFTTWRNHGHLLARGAEPGRMMAEILGKASGYAGGKSGTLHLAVRELGIPTTSALVGGTLPLATGAALACKQQGRGVVVCFFGDAALEEGATYEALILASLWQLPVLFVCENNTLPSDRRARLQAPSSTLPAARLKDVPEALQLDAQVLDGSDASALLEAMQGLISAIRTSATPRFAEVCYTRWPGIVPSWPDLPAGEWQLAWAFGEQPGNADIAAWLGADPVSRYVRQCVAAGTLDRGELQAIDARARTEMAQAVKFALESADPAPEQAYRHVFA